MNDDGGDSEREVLTTPAKRFRRSMASTDLFGEAEDALSSLAIQKSRSDASILSSPVIDISHVSPAKLGVSPSKIEAAAVDKERRGTAGFWIARMPLKLVLSGDNCGKAAHQAEQLLKNGKLENAGVRRLRRHMELRGMAMRLQKASLQQLTQDEASELITEVLKAGVEIPVHTKVEFIKFRAEPFWQAILSNENTTKSIIRLLDMFCPWQNKKLGHAFDFKEPILADAGMTDHSVSEALIFEFWSSQLASILANTSTLNLERAFEFANALLNRWIIPEDADIGTLTAKVYMESRKACKAFLYLKDPVLRMDTDITVWKDIRFIDELAHETTKPPSVFSIFGQALQESIEMRTTLGQISRKLTSLLQKGPKIIKEFAKFKSEPHSPSVDMAKRLEETFSELPLMQTFFIPGMLEEFEACAAETLCSSSNKLVADVEEGEEIPSELLIAYQRAIQAALGTLPSRDDIRRLATKVNFAKDKIGFASMITDMKSLIERYISGEHDMVDNITNLLSKCKSDDIIKDCGDKLKELIEHILTSMKSEDMAASKPNAALNLLDSIVLVVDKRGELFESTFLSAAKQISQAHAYLEKMPNAEELSQETALHPTNQGNLTGAFRVLSKLEVHLKKLGKFEKRAGSDLIKEQAAKIQKEAKAFAKKVMSFLEDTVESSLKVIEDFFSSAEASTWKEEVKEGMEIEVIGEIASRTILKFNHTDLFGKAKASREVVL